jgi:RimJ/RimL family protein N-acetyltransferase
MISEAISAKDMDRLADWLGDEPGHTIPLHALRTRRCSVRLAGDAGAPEALVMIVDYLADEPYAFGRDAAKAVELLQGLGSWTCVNVSGEFADSMVHALSAATKKKTIARNRDIYFAQSRPLRIPAHPAIRFLTAQDTALFTRASKDVTPGSPEFVDRLLREGYCTGAVVDGTLVAQTHAYCITARYAEIGATTAKSHRARGLSTACAGMLCARLFEEGKTPVWSTFETNLASQRVADKLGFERVAERVYLRVE